MIVVARISKSYTGLSNATSNKLFNKGHKAVRLRKEHRPLKPGELHPPTPHPTPSHPKPGNFRHCAAVESPGLERPNREILPSPRNGFSSLPGLSRSLLSGTSPHHPRWNEQYEVLKSAQCGSSLCSAAAQAGSLQGGYSRIREDWGGGPCVVHGCHS